MEAVTEFFDKIKDFIITEGENPWFWLILFFAGIGMFYVVYNALHKN